MVGRSGRSCLATCTIAGFLKRCTETANSTFTLVCHRLLHLFQFYGVKKATSLTCLWPAYMLHCASNQHACSSTAARTRMDNIWEAWHTCLAANSNLLQTDYPQAVGYFLDCHVRLVTQGKHKSIAYIMQNKLAPEQSTSTLKISQKLHNAVASLWHEPTSCTMPIIKLLQKGLPRPRSVRYIRPQVIRCGMCETSKEIGRELIINWMLGRYAHRKDIAGPKRRIAAWGQNFEQLSKVLLQLPSRSLYYVIAECLAAVTVNSPSLHIRAVGTVKGFANYVHHATMSASVALKSPTVRLRQCVAQMPKQTVVHKRTKKSHVYSIQQWPCNAKTQILQKINVSKN